MSSIEDAARAGDWHAVALALGCLPHMRASGHVLDLKAKARLLDRTTTPMAGFGGHSLATGALFVIQQGEDASLAVQMWPDGVRREAHVGFQQLNYDATQCSRGEWCPIVEHRMHCENWANYCDGEDYEDCAVCDHYHTCSSCENERPLCAAHGVSHSAIYIYS